MLARDHLPRLAALASLALLSGLALLVGAAPAKPGGDGRQAAGKQQLRMQSFCEKQSRRATRGNRACKRWANASQARPRSRSRFRARIHGQVRLDERGHTQRQSQQAVSQPAAPQPSGHPGPVALLPAPEPEAVQPKPEPTPEPGPTPAPAPPPESEPTPTPAPSSIYWGAWIHDHLTGGQAPWDMGAVSTLEELVDKPLSVVNFSAPFANCGGAKCTYYNFPAGEFNNIRSYGAIPFYSWGSQSIPATLNQPDFQLSDVIEGRHDAHIRNFATAARNWGKPFFLRFNWEMNGGWFAWAEGANGNKKGEFVAAWRHVHDIFTEVGATNATWVWCPNIDPDNRFQDLSGLYPGDEYVDWTGLDGYNWGTNPAAPDRWRSFDQLYRSTYDRIVETIAPSKPMIVSEVGSTEHGGSKASWIKDMLAKVPTAYPKIRGLLWFEKYDDGMDWPLVTSTDAVDAFAAGIGSPVYAGNSFGSLTGARVQPPG